MKPEKGIKVTFTKDFDWRDNDAGGLRVIAYKAGMTINVTSDCAEKAIASGAAEKTGKQKK